jgi:hypothetical protein
MEKNMTYSLTTASQAFLQPEHLMPASALIRDRTLVPAEAGIYAWWFRTELPPVPSEGTLEKDGYRLLYVGIAPRRPSRAGRESQGNLRKRILSNHLGNSLGRSTLRRSLASLLAEPMRFTIGYRTSKKMMIPREQEKALTEWLGAHAAVSWLAYSAPWTLEDYLLQKGPALPLNIKGSAHEFGKWLSVRRGKTPNIDDYFDRSAS